MNDDLRAALSHLQSARKLLSGVANDLAVDAAADGPPRGFDIDDLYGLDFPLGRITSALHGVEKIIKALEEEVA